MSDSNPELKVAAGSGINHFGTDTQHWGITVKEHGKLILAGIF